MRKSFLLFALTSFLCFVRFAEGQVDPGVPPFSAYDSHEGDTINLMNNNIVLNIPVMSKSGAFALHFSLIGDSFMSVLGPPTPRWFSNFTNNFQVAGFANGYLGGFASAGGSVSATC